MLTKTMLAILVFPIALMGCVGPTVIWSSNPVFEQVENPYFLAMVEPKMDKKGLYIAFHLEVTNKSDENLAIDWNETQYLFQGKKAGQLVPAGIDPKEIREYRVPSEEITPGQTIVKEVGPLSFVAFTPSRNKPEKMEQSQIIFGPLPAGYNGIQLVIRTVDKAIVEHLQMKFSKQ
jgi:hypothetical protein